VAPGEFVALLGPSGCGKSTLLRLLSGLATPSSGTIQVGDRPPGEDSGLAYVFQDPTLLPWLRVAANVETLLRLRRLPAPERARRRDAALALVGLADRARAYPRELSGGQKMRVSLARALATSPRVLLLDEHSVSEAVFLARRVLILAARPGRVAHDLTIDLPYPRNRDTRRDPAYLRLVAAVSARLHEVEANPA
jgi:NitT/TauT family transport system ATP-binding protein